MRRGLSATEARVLMAVRAFHRLDPPRAPTLAEVAHAIGWRHATSVAPYVRKLAAAGYVHRVTGRAGIQLTEHTDGVPR